MSRGAVTIVKGLGLSRFRGVLLLLVDALRLAFTGTSNVGRVFRTQQLIIKSLHEHLDKFEQEELELATERINNRDDLRNGGGE